jgi:hypothetical protein
LIILIILWVEFKLWSSSFFFISNRIN